MKRVVHRKMPDGSFQNVQPFHVSMEGLEKTILCRCDNDYDAMVKILCICARRKNVLIIVYAVVSNHCHVAVLAVNQADADAFGQEVKRMYAMWFSRQYGEQKRLQKTDVKAICLDNDWYVRNALAYIYGMLWTTAVLSMTIAGLLTGPCSAMNAQWAQVIDKSLPSQKWNEGSRCIPAIP